MRPQDHIADDHLALQQSHASRRQFIAASGAGFGSLALLSMLAGENGNTQTLAADPPAQPMAPKPPMLETKAKSVIFLFMFGGPSQVDLFDYKPELQSRDGQTIENEFRRGTKTKAVLQASRRSFAQHGQSGLWCSDAFPNIAKHMDKRFLCARERAAPNQQRSHSARSSLARFMDHLWTGFYQSEPSRLCGDARSSRRSDERSPQLVERLHARSVSRNPYPHFERADPQSAASS
jgi:hypothetical protein